MTRAARLLALAAATAATAAMLASPAPLRAQAVGGVGEDALGVPRGVFRVRIGGAWEEIAERFVLRDGERVREGWLAAVARPSLDGTTLPALAQREGALRFLSGDDDARLSLGRLDAEGVARRATTTLAIDYGVTRRLGVFARLPYVDARQYARLRLNADGASATAGPPPAAAAANEAVFGQLENARAALADAITQCAAPDATGATCDAIAANPAAAGALVTRTEAIRQAWGLVYGGGGAVPPAVIPVAGSRAHEAVSAQLTALAAAFDAFGIGGVPTGVPAGATSVFGPGSLAALVDDGLIGVSTASAGPQYRAGFGDIALGATWLAYDTWGNDQPARLATTRRGARVLTELGWRFGSANRPPSDLAFALPTGEGTSALLARVSADVVFSRRLWLSGTARLLAPQSGDVFVRLSAPDDPGAFLTTPPVPASWTPGRTLQLELAPRVGLTETVALSAAWRMRQRAGDRYAPRDGGPATTLDDVTVHRASLGIMFSTLAPYVRGGAKLPLEVLFSHDVTLGMGSGPAPVIVQDRLELRVYPRFPRARD